MTSRKPISPEDLLTDAEISDAADELEGLIGRAIDHYGPPDTTDRDAEPDMTADDEEDNPA